tara:strand:+ start:14209 stop:14655 length:447 start_codon:yes stop_codon:yes gene_type:complete
MKRGTNIMFYIAPMIVLLGAVSFHYFARRIPTSLNPIVAVTATYVAIAIIASTLIPLFPSDGGLLKQVRQLSWIQIAMAISIIFLDIGFILMYRNGWNLSTGNLVTSVFTNIALLAIGVLLIGDKATPMNLAGVLICIAGVAMIGYQP